MFAAGGAAPRENLQVACTVNDYYNTLERKNSSRREKCYLIGNRDERSMIRFKNSELQNEAGGGESSSRMNHPSKKLASYFEAIRLATAQKEISI